MRSTRFAAAAVVLGALFVQASPAAAAPATQCAEPGTAITQVPWAQERQSPERIWPVADGSGTRVAVLASGVDAAHPQLAGRVRTGEDYLPGGSSGADTDCEGGGTQIAGVIAAAPIRGVGFSGLAPGTTVEPYRVATSTVVENGDDADSGSPTTLADAIRDVAAARPDVLVVPVVSYVDDPGLKAAVAAAVAADVVVIAAVGDGRPPGDGPAVPYPAAYDGVVGVAAVNQEGVLLGDGTALPYVDLAGPGDSLVSTQVGGGLVEVAGSAIAAGYVAGTAALIRGRWPDAKAADVVRRLLATATPTAAGAGDGIVNPAQAVTATMTSASPAALDTARERTSAAAEDDRGSTIAMISAAVLAAVAVLGVAFALAIPRGRKRRWRPGLAPRPEEFPEDDAPSPPRMLFEDWTPKR